MKLSSGAELNITVASFAESRDLYQAVLEEARSLKLDPDAEVDINLWKDLFCSAMGSKKIEKCLFVCMKRVTYNGMRITNPEETFEPVEARGDYMEVCLEVAKANILPFMKSLYAQYGQVLSMLKSVPA